MTDEQAIKMAEEYRRKTGLPIVHIPPLPWETDVITVNMLDPRRLIVTRAPPIKPGD